MRSAVESNTVTLAQFTAPDTAPGGITQITVNPQASSNTGFFGSGGPSFRDLLDTINPLNHIPIVSDIYAEAVGHIPSVGSQLAGGALFGGPIGFAASLVNVIFEQQTGKGAVSTMVAALSSDTPATTQLADASTGSAPAATASTETPTQLAMADTTPADPQNARNKALLDLYGGSAQSAHRSYQKAQFLPYLKDVNSSQVL